MFKYIVFQVSVIYRQHHPEHRALQLYTTIPRCLVHWCFQILSFPIQEKKDLNS